MSVFGEAYSKQYDGLYAAKDYKFECDMLQEAITRCSPIKPRSLLDVGCGTGGHALELARRGYNVTGVDLSQAMLDAAANKSDELLDCTPPKWLLGDMRTFETGQRHDFAYMMFAVIGYMNSNDDVIAGLANIRRHLNIGSLFVCDFWYGPSVLATRPTDRIREVSTLDSLVIRAANTELDIASHTAEVTFKLWALDRGRLMDQTVEKHHVRYFFPQEFSLFLSCSGFKLNSITSFPSLDDKLTNESWNALVVATAV